MAHLMHLNAAMNDKIILVVSTGTQINHSAVTAAFEGYDSQPVGTGAWLLKTNVSPREVLAKTKAAFTEGEVAIFSLDKLALSNAILPKAVAQYAGVMAA